MSNVIEFGQDFKEIAEFKAYIAAQTKTITSLSKQMQEKDVEIAHLKDLLEKTTPILNTDPGFSVPTSGLLSEDEEIIIRTQLRLLKQEAMVSELTLEQSKKFDVYFKALTQMRNQPQKMVIETKKMSDQDLLAALAQLEAPKKDE